MRLCEHDRMTTKRRDPASALRRLAQNIRRRRENIHLTQEDVAASASVSVRHYQKIESGAVDVRYTSLAAIAAALTTTIGEIAA